MIRIKTLLLLASTLSVLGLGCSDDDDKKSEGGENSCTKANKILADCGDEDNQLSSACSAQEKAFADCVVRYPAGACDEDGTSSESDDFFDCAFGQ